MNTAIQAAKIMNTATIALPLSMIAATVVEC